MAEVHTKKKYTPEQLRDDPVLLLSESMKAIAEGRVKKVKRVIE